MRQCLLAKDLSRFLYINPVLFLPVFRIPVLWVRITLMQIRIRLVTLKRIRIQIFIYLMTEFLLDADPDPTFYPDTNPDLDPSFQINAVPFLGSETGSNLLVRIRIRESVPLTNGS